MLGKRKWFLCHFSSSRQRCQIPLILSSQYLLKGEQNAGGGNKENKPRFNGQCYYCGKRGHMKKDCRKLKAKRAQDASANVSRDVDSGDDDEIMLMGLECSSICHTIEFFTFTHKRNAYIIVLLRYLSTQAT